MEDKLTIDLVCLAFIRWALHDWVELLRVDELINLIAAAVTSVNSDLHARLDIACTGHNASDLNELANILCLHISHLHHVLSAKLAWH